MDGEGLPWLDEAWDFDEFGRLGRDFSVRGGGCAEIGRFRVENTLPYMEAALAI